MHAARTRIPHSNDTHMHTFLRLTGKDRENKSFNEKLLNEKNELSSFYDTFFAACVGLIPMCIFINPNSPNQ